MGHAVSPEEAHVVSAKPWDVSMDVMAPFSSHRPMAMCLRTKKKPSTRRAQPEHLLRRKLRLRYLAQNSALGVRLSAKLVLGTYPSLPFVNVNIRGTG